MSIKLTISDDFNIYTDIFSPQFLTMRGFLKQKYNNKLSRAQAKCSVFLKFIFKVLFKVNFSFITRN